MRSRGLKPGFFKNEDLASLPALARLLFAALWGLADREGRLEDRPKQIKAEALPYDDCDVDAMLTALSVASTDDKPFIVRYSVNGRKYIWIPSFRDHQNPHYKEEASKIPPFAGSFIIEPSSGDDKPIIDQSSGYDPGHGCTLTPDSGLLTPDSSSDSSDTSPPICSRSKKHTSVDTSAETAVFDLWMEVMQKDFRTSFDPARRTAVRRALKVLTLEEAFQAVRGCALSPHNMGENDRQTRYNDLTLIFRDATHWERFIETGRNGKQAAARRFTGAEEAQIKAALAVYAEEDYAGAQDMVSDELWKEVMRRAD